MLYVEDPLSWEQLLDLLSKELEVANGHFEAYLSTYSHVCLFYYTLGFCLVTYLLFCHIWVWISNLSHQIWLEHGAVNYFSKHAFAFVITLPIVRGIMKSQLDKEKDKYIDSIKKERKNEVYEMPQTPWKDETILKRMRDAGGESTAMAKRGQISGAIYINDDKHWEVVCEAMKTNIYANPIHVDDFKFCCQLEAETIRMTIDLYRGDKSCKGILSSGGTESIFLATHSYREQGKALRGIYKGNVIACETAHCGLDKACHYLGLELRKI
jgi:hypothetical protein